MSADNSQAASQTDEEKLLLDFDRINRSKAYAGRVAGILTFANQKNFERNREAYNIVVHNIRNLIGRQEGTMYCLHDYSIVVFVRLSERFFDTSLEKLVLELDDILIRNNVALGLTPGEAEEAVKWYRFDQRLDDLASWIEDANQRYKVNVERRKRLIAKAGGGAGTSDGTPLTPASLQQIEDILRKADLTTFLKRQPVCICFPNQPPKQIFQEIYVSINDLKQAVAPNVNIRSAKNLFNHLTRTMDSRIFRSLLDGFVTRSSGPFSINLNVATVLSPEFRDFDSRIGTVLKKEQVIVELQRHDVFLDYNEYLLACEFLQNNGYRTLLDGVTADTLSLFGRKELRADFVKIHYNKDRAEDWASKTMSNLIAEADPNRVIMGRCENEEALRLGFAAGVRLYQGWHIDALLKSSRDVIN